MRNKRNNAFISLWLIPREKFKCTMHFEFEITDLGELFTFWEWNCQRRDGYAPAEIYV